MRNLERATFLATILGLVLLVGVLYLKVSSDDAGDAPSSAVVPSPPAGTVVATSVPGAVTTPPAIGPTPSSRLAGVVVNVRRENSFVWPASGPVTSFFGPGHPTGVDIALSPDVDSPIHAAASGTVSFVGGNVCCDYGLSVVVDHGGGTSTLYGHLASFRVQQGQVIDQGQVIGLGGSTGNASGKHLHFELNVAGSMVDPLRYFSVTKRTAPDAGVQVFACKPGTIPVEPSSIVRVSFLPTLSVDMTLESVTLDAPLPGTGAPIVDLVKDGNLAILSIGPVSVAFGQTYTYNLKAELVQPGNLRQSVECSLVLETLETFPNVIDSGDDSGSLGAEDATPTRAPGDAPVGPETPLGPGATGVPPSATAVRSTPVPTATRGAPAPAAFPSATPAAPKGALFPTATSAAPKPLAVPSATSAAPKPAYVPTKVPTAAPR